jgi:hypothetical protein
LVFKWWFLVHLIDLDVLNHYFSLVALDVHEKKGDIIKTSINHDCTSKLVRKLNKRTTPLHYFFIFVKKFKLICLNMILFEPFKKKVSYF